MPPVVKRVSTPTLGMVSQQGVPSVKMRSSKPGTPRGVNGEGDDEDDDDKVVEGMGEEVDDDDDEEEGEGDEVDVDHICVPSTHHLSPMHTKGTGVDE